MSWLRKFMGIESQSAKPKVFRTGCDATYEANSDIIDGCCFYATLQVRTPLRVLERHGEVFLGSPSRAPQIGDGMQDGIWLFRLRGPGGYAFDGDSLSASDIGQTRPSNYLPFLKKFRGIVEANLSHQEQLHRLQLLAKTMPRIWTKLKDYYGNDFPKCFFYRKFEAIPGVGRKTAAAMYAAGFCTWQDVERGSEAEFRDVAGIGAKTARLIVAYCRDFASCE